LLRKELNWSTYHLSRGSKNNKSKVVQLNFPHQTLENESMLLTTNLSTDLQSVLKFRFDTFELTRRRFPHPEQTSNGVSDKSLMKELDREEHADGVALDVLNIDQMKHSDACVCVCFWPPVQDELLLSMRFQSLVLTSMTSPPYPRPQ